MRYTFILRHGQRADHTAKATYDFADKPPDPVLTPLGMQQATETGKYLKKYLKELEKKEGRKFDKVIVVTSPFVRSMQTAGRLSKEMGIKEAGICFQISEILNEGVFPRDPFPHLERLKMSASKLDKKYSLSGLKFKEYEEPVAHP